MFEYGNWCLGAPYELSDAEKLVVQVAQEYIRRTDEFDKCHCREVVDGKRTGMPKYFGELGLCRKHALDLRKSLLEKYGVPYPEFKKALNSLQRLQDELSNNPRT